MPTYILFRYLDCVHFVNYLHVVDLFIRIRLLSAVVGGRPRHIHGLRGKNWVSNGTLFGTCLSPCGVEESVA